MATLHVRNVPDELYELLRTRAAAEGRSIGAETVALLRQRLEDGAAAPRRFSLPSRRRSAGRRPFGRFTPEARRVVVDAQVEARSLDHGFIGTEHLLLGLLGGEPPSPAAAALAGLGLMRERARAEVERLAGRGGEPPPARLPFTARAKQTFELALREAADLGDAALEPEHLLLALVRLDEGVAAEILRAVEPDAAAIREAVLRSRAAEQAYAPAPEAVPAHGLEYRVLELAADGADWQAQLNDAAAEGYELVEIVERRAVLRLA